ncbi:MAG: hypothetical protein RBQ94_04665 [Methanimicrococcus sp.]|nr:hypothetical protein [Methanimicrococcus sp.]
MQNHELLSEITTTFITSILKFNDEDNDICAALFVPQTPEHIKFYDENGQESKQETAAVKEYKSENITVTRNLKTKAIQIKGFPAPYDENLFKKLFVIKSYYGSPYELSAVLFKDGYSIPKSDSDAMQKFFEKQVLVYEYIQKRYRYLPNDAKELAFEINDGKLEIKIKTKNQQSLTELIDLLLENKILLKS